MIIKRISCMVKEGNKEAFYEYQKQWRHLSKAKGFLGQVGGWGITQPLTACVYSFWDNKVDYQEFMKEEHDQIFVNSGQESTYESIDVSLFQEELKVSGLEDNIVKVLRKCKYIRVALGQVKDYKMKHFIDMQKKVWNIEMKKSQGMIGGTFAFSEKQSNDFLVLTGWESEDSHKNYTEDIFPELLKITKPKNDVLELKGEQFKVEESWRVFPINY